MQIICFQGLDFLLFSHVYLKCKAIKANQSRGWGAKPRVFNIEDSRVAVGKSMQDGNEANKFFDKTKKLRQSTIRAPLIAIAMRDPYIASHQRRVTKLAYLIARTLKLNAKQIQHIILAAAFHDIGKIRIPLEILFAPRRLTESEMNIVKEHPQTAYEILITEDDFANVADIILQHHERINGSGYPCGCINENISTEAKVLSVADVVEAMCSDRPYRPALGIKKASMEIKNNSGILYEPGVVSACLQVLFRSKSFKSTRIEPYISRKSMF